MKQATKEALDQITSTHRFKRGEQLTGRYCDLTGAKLVWIGYFTESGLAKMKNEVSSSDISEFDADQANHTMRQIEKNGRAKISCDRDTVYLTRDDCYFERICAD